MRSWALAFLFVVVGCGGSVGGDDETAAGGSGGSTAQGGSAGTAVGQGGTAGVGGAPGTGGGTIEPGPFTGVWKGYVENYKFDDSTDTVTMTLYSVSSGVSGIVVFGDRPLYAPPTDPNVGYPTGATLTDYGKWKFGAGPLSGVEYRMVNGAFDGTRLQFDIETRQLWEIWCGMQTPYQTSGEGYNCLPATGGSTNPNTNKCEYSDLQGNMVPVDCGKFELCMGPGFCECQATGCTFWHGFTNHFDMQLTSTKADGSLNLGSVHNVHLTH